MLDVPLAGTVLDLTPFPTEYFEGDLFELGLDPPSFLKTYLFYGAR